MLVRSFILSCVAFFGLSLAVANADMLTPAQRNSVQQTLDAFKTYDKINVAARISYPFARQNSLPPITQPVEMVQKFDEVFDLSLYERIAQSSVNDWHAMGSHGVMFENGLVWLTDDGLVRSVNYQPETARVLSENLVQQQNQNMHSSLVVHQESVLDWRTKNYHVRVDKLYDGKLRYAAWQNGKSINTKPDLVLTGGQVVEDGTGGNTYYIFKNGSYSYVCRVVNLGNSSSSNGVLEVYKSTQMILSENATNI